jgi:hypothetical protein
MSDTFQSIAYEALRREGVIQLHEKNDVIVLERIAAGAGRTCWYFVSKESDLSGLVGHLSPGSFISFYFDKRFERVRYNSRARRAIERICVRHKEAVVAVRESGGAKLKVFFVAGLEDLDDLEREGDLLTGVEIFIGVYPGADNSGTDAVSLTLPDSDGVVRDHPY